MLARRNVHGWQCSWSSVSCHSSLREARLNDNHGNISWLLPVVPSARPECSFGRAAARHRPVVLASCLEDPMLQLLQARWAGRAGQQEAVLMNRPAYRSPAAAF